jgi:hypothetical protein
LTPKKYQSGQTDDTGRISRHGDASAREALYEAAHLMLTKPIKGCSELKSWAMRIARRAGANKAKVALAPKLAVIMLRTLKVQSGCQGSNGLTTRRTNRFSGGPSHRALPESEVPSPGRWTRPGRRTSCRRIQRCDHAVRRLADLFLL